MSQMFWCIADIVLVSCVAEKQSLSGEKSPVEMASGKRWILLNMKYTLKNNI